MTANVYINMEPIVSVHMITYNHEPYIRAAVEGVLGQRVDFPIELVIGDDHSTDQTGGIVDSYQRQYPNLIRVVRRGSNLGARRNALLTHSECRGKYIAYCEGDDVWNDPGKLQKQCERLEREQAYGLVHTNYHKLDVARSKLYPSVLSHTPTLNDDNAYAEFLVGRRNILTLTVFARRALVDVVIREHSECTDLQWPMGDTQLWLELCRVCKVKYISDTTATYRLLPESASQSRDPTKRLRFVQRGGDLLLHYLKKYPVEKAVENRVRERVSTAILEAAYFACKRTDAEIAFAELKRIRGGMLPSAQLYRLGARNRRAFFFTRLLLRVVLPCRRYLKPANSVLL